jgi:formiminotetrahydrofolate cyclodeaminase
MAPHLSPSSACPCAVVVLAFSLPKAYEAKQQDIDRLLDAVSVKAKELYAKADEAIFKKIHRGVSTPKKED